MLSPVYAAPMSAEEALDVVVIGTGQAGVPLATRLAAAGKRVVIVERGKAGGTCVNVGCTPTKTLVASARAAHQARTAARLGVHVGELRVDFREIMARKDAVVKRWREGVEHRLAGAGAHLRLVRGHARFVGARTIEVNGQRFRGEQVVINVGARAAVPSIAGLNEVPHLDSSGLLNLRALPRHLLILGAGYIGCELGQMFRRFGADVTIVAPSKRLLPREDPAVSEALKKVFESEGIVLALAQRTEQVAQVNGQIELRVDGGAVIRGSELLVATGRVPNTNDLGCAAGGVALDDQGYVAVDERYQSRAPGVFAVGDCVPGPQFTHVSWDDHRVLYETLMGGSARPRTQRLVPYTIFTDPQVAGVGLSEASARERGLDFEVASMPFGDIARAIETDETAGVIKVVVDRVSEQVLGATICGVDAGELIHVFSMLMQAGAPLRTLVDAEMVHPTFAEGLQTAVMKLPRYALS